MDKETGGAAFPQSGFERWAPEGGMTLRDYFAAKALTKIAPTYADMGELIQAEAQSIESVIKTSASYAYALADAMLAARAA